MTLQVKLSSGTWWTRAKPAEAVTDEEVAEALAEMRADPRVARVEYKGRVLQGRPAFEIEATDTQEGDLVGLFSIGRCLNALSETQAAHRERLARNRAEGEAAYAAMMAERRAEEERQRAARGANLRRLRQQGFNPYDLARYVNALAAGRYIEPDHPGADAFAWYFREIVRGGPQPMRLGLYLADFTD